MNDHEQQQPAPRRGKVLEALARAERKCRFPNAVSSHIALIWAFIS